MPIVVCILEIKDIRGGCDEEAPVPWQDSVWEYQVPGKDITGVKQAIPVEVSQSYNAALACIRKPFPRMQRTQE